jgi:tRNA threonylcarbamoyl adenosine modification protein YeaZ
MNILAVDTTEDALTLALQAGEEVYRLTRKVKAPHDETLLPAIGSLLKKAGLERRDLDGIAAASGPGRFTGIRIGMAYTAVAAGQLKIPALAVSRFEALAAKVPGERVCAAIPGWREERAYQLFTRRGKLARPDGPPRWAAPADWEKEKAVLVAGGWVVAETRPEARDLLEPAWRYLAARRLPKFEPVYGKPASYEHKARPVR